MKALHNMLVLCAGVLVVTVTPLRADFVSTATLTAAADDASNSTGSGSVTVDWNASSGSFTYTLSWAGLTGVATMAHIHYGAAGVAGPVVIPFFMPSSPSGYLPATDTISGTLTAADFIADPAAGINSIADVASAIEDGDAYVNIHTVEYPSGELRGQLAVSPEPATTGLILMSLIGGLLLLARKRRSAVTDVSFGSSPARLR